MDIFTSITINYLPKARILANSIKEFHSDWNFHLLINDKPTKNANGVCVEFDKRLFDRVIWTKELDIGNISAWIFKHNIVELCTAVKGPFLRQLIDEGSEKILYIDPDIVLFNPISALEDLLDDHSILLPPHLLDYTDNPQSISNNEIQGALRHGTFNFGFLGINATKSEGLRFSDWWNKRLLNYCYADYDRDLFTDQKWCDLIPPSFSDYHIIRNPGYNAASWNPNCRELSFNEQGQLLVNNDIPLNLYHFTGYDSGAELRVIEQFAEKSKNHIVQELRNWYRRQLVLNGHNKLGNIPCSYQFFDNGEEILEEMRKLYRSRPDLEKRFPDPFAAKKKINSYYSWYSHKYASKICH